MAPIQFLSGFSGTTPSSTNFLHASATASIPPFTEAVRVPPSASRTSQSISIVIPGIFSKSTAILSERPIKRWISAVLPEILVLSRALLTFVEPGRSEYSAVSQPPLLTCGGTLKSSESAVMTLVFPETESTEE